MGSLRFRLDIDRLGELLKADKNVIDTVDFKDGSKHRMVTVSVMERREVKNNSTHYLRVDMYHKQEVQGVNYFLGDCYPINFGAKAEAHQGQQQQQTAQAPAQVPEEPPTAEGSADDLPF